MIEGDRHANPVAGPQLLGQANEPAVVQDVAMRQRRALGQASSPAGELDVDRIVAVQACADFVDAAQVGRRRQSRRVIEPEPARVMRPPDTDPVLEREGVDGIEHRHIVAGLEPLRGHHGFHPHLV